MDVFFFVLQILGTIGFSVSGAMVAIRRETDIAGVVILALTTTFGGGIMRDLCISSAPPRFFTMYTEIAVSVATALLVFFLARHYKEKYLEKEGALLAVDNVFDAIGIGVFAVIGTEIALDAGHTAPLLAILMGTVSGVGGGVVRDVLVRDIPFILKKRIYVVAVLAGATVYYLLWLFGAPDMLSLSVGAATVFTLRMLATAFKWNLPKAIVFSSLRPEEKKKPSSDEKNKKVS